MFDNSNFPKAVSISCVPSRYATHSEELHRRSVFLSNSADIASHNQRVAEALTGSDVINETGSDVMQTKVFLAMNSFGDLKPSEFFSLVTSPLRSEEEIGTVGNLGDKRYCSIFCNLFAFS